MDITLYKNLVTDAWSIFKAYAQAPLTDANAEEFTQTILDETNIYEQTEVELIRREMVSAYISEYQRLYERGKSQWLPEKDKVTQSDGNI